MKLKQLKRYINLSFVVAGLIFWVVFVKFIATVMGSLEIRDTQLLGEQITTSTLIGTVAALALTFGLWSSPKIQVWANEIAVELSKVTWPTWDETKRNTIVVIVFSIVVSGILASFDFFWKWLTNLILVG